MDSDMTRLDIERSELREFTAEVQAEAARNLDFLRAIESTLAWLERLNKQLQADAEFAERVNEGLPSIEGVIDPDEAIQQALESAQTDVEKLYCLLIEKRGHGRNDSHLTLDDGIEDAYTQAIAQAADLHNAINTLRWSIGEHDIDADEHRVRAENLISDPASLRAALLALRK